MDAISISTLPDWLDCPQRALNDRNRVSRPSARLSAGQAVGNATANVFAAMLNYAEQNKGRLSDDEAEHLAQQRIPDGVTEPRWDNMTPTRAAAIKQAVLLSTQAAEHVIRIAEGDAIAAEVGVSRSVLKDPETVIQGRVDAVIGEPHDRQVLLELKVVSEQPVDVREIPGNAAVQVAGYALAMNTETTSDLRVIVASRKSGDVVVKSVPGQIVQHARKAALIAAYTITKIPAAGRVFTDSGAIANPLSRRCFNCKYRATEHCSITRKII